VKEVAWEGKNTSLGMTGKIGIKARSGKIEVKRKMGAKDLREEEKFEREEGGAKRGCIKVGREKGE